jgi:hypothetical protein
MCLSLWITGEFYEDSKQFFSGCRVMGDILLRLVTIIVSHIGPKNLIFSGYRNDFPESKAAGARILILYTLRRGQE